jgi:hypothetical protein
VVLRHDVLRLHREDVNVSPFPFSGVPRELDLEPLVGRQKLALRHASEVVVVGGGAELDLVGGLDAEDNEIEERLGPFLGDGVAEDLAAREDLEDGLDDDVGYREA